jgi:hypothetical protein
MFWDIFKLFIGVIFGGLILFIIIIPYLKLVFMKKKYGDKVEIYFYPILGYFSLFKGKNEEEKKDALN